MSKPRLIKGCFFLSGATSLTLEVAWSKELSYILGNSLFAVSTVVAAFMAGLALGSAVIGRWGERFSRPLRTYAGLQLVVALFGAASIPMFRATGGLFQALHRTFDPGHGAFLLVRFLAVLGLMFVPVMAMGMTLPVMVGALGRGQQSYHRDAGVLYGLNTLGAVAGTLGSAFFLIPGLGLLRACLAAAAGDLVLAGCALALDRRIGAIASERRRVAWTRRQWTVGIAFGASGVVAMLYEVGWFRLLGLTMGPSVYAFSAMLAMYLVGVGLGSTAAARWAAGTRLGGWAAMALLETLLGIAGLLALYFANRLPTLNVRLFQWMSTSMPGWVGAGSFALRQLAVAALLVLPPCLVMGALFPVTVRAVREAGPDLSPEATVGRLYVLNTAGGIVGSLVAGFALVPRAGVWASLTAAGLASVLIGAVLTLRAPVPARVRQGPAIGAPVVAVALAFFAPRFNAALFNQGLYRNLYLGPKLQTSDRTDELIFHREGVNASVAVYRAFGGATLHIGGKPDASTNPGDVQTQLLSSHLAMLFARRPRTVAVLGYGSGMTAAGVLAHPEVARMDLMEIERAVVDASPYFESVNHNPLGDPRTRLVLEDGRIHLAYTDALYDVIISEPSNPWMAGISNLFTTDFYQTVRRRLEADGLFAQWIQNYDMTREVFGAIVASIHEAFAHLVVFQPNPWDTIVLASAQPIAVPWERLKARFEAAPVRSSLLSIDIRNPYELGFFLLSPESDALELARGARFRNTDDNVWLEHRMPFELQRASSENVGIDLLSRSAAHRLAALEQMIPGVGLGALLFEMVSFPHRGEPIPGGAAYFSDPWRDTRPIQVAGLEVELAARGRADLARSVRQWDRRGDSYRESRARVAEALAGAVRTTGHLPAPDVVQRLLGEAPDLPMALASMGSLREDAGDLEGASGFWKQILDRPRSGAYYDALLGLARAARARKDGDEARRLAEQAVARNLYIDKAYLFLAGLDLERRAHAAARRRLEQGLRFNPRNADLEKLLARIPRAQ